MHSTQKAIAGRLGVSASLVSRALRGQAERIGAHPDTIRRICAEAARCGYAPNVAALSLRGGATRMLGVVVRDFTDPFFGPIVGALQRLAAAADYSLVMTGGGAEGCDAPDLLPLNKYRLDGFILVGSDFSPRGLEQVLRRGVPVVRLGTGDSADGVVQVCVEQEAGFSQLLAYLQQLGHSRIGYLGHATPGNVRREAALRAAMTGAGVAVRAAAFVHAADTAPAAVTEALRRLRSGSPAVRPTALVASDDVMALTLLRVLHESGVVVPRDLSVAGVDDIPFAHLAVPALTTIRPPLADMAERVFQLASGRAPAAGAGPFEIRPELVVRESCAPPSGK
jgi:DNA-binding LacI/PurR family transcriptional regulator